ncbi:MULTISPECIES: DUF1697 domain-containing protein [unclassified Flavobacterium]|uniref:DUF1697 domain-containing protein n=1 Tax=unclassified Flavobacterium TaxID=196869 RepID=UPI001F1366A8|nr:MULTISPECIES: DUF1697 domain-containing protein [unclassified Flavobacterium]UMY65087.1 DUF1697 domain-containing protein [Flavobacterium sp. HJ-32-4]
MTRFVALLRAVNVGGTVLKMDALRGAMQTLPVSGVTTYIQSGNVLFSAEGTALDWQERIAQLIRDHFSLDVAVMVLTAADVAQALAANPYHTEPDDVNPYFGFLLTLPDDAGVSALAEIDFGRDEYTLQGKVIYVCYAEGAGSTKLTNAVIERKLGVKGTMRNQKTVRRLLELLQA